MKYEAQGETAASIKALHDLFFFYLNAFKETYTAFTERVQVDGNTQPSNQAEKQILNKYRGYLLKIRCAKRETLTLDIQVKPFLCTLELRAVRFPPGAAASGRRCGGGCFLLPGPE